MGRRQVVKQSAVRNEIVWSSAWVLSGRGRFGCAELPQQKMRLGLFVTAIQVHPHPQAVPRHVQQCCGGGGRRRGGHRWWGCCRGLTHAVQGQWHQEIIHHSKQKVKHMHGCLRREPMHVDAFVQTSKQMALVQQRDQDQWCLGHDGHGKQDSIDTETTQVKIDEPTFGHLWRRMRGKNRG